MFQRFRCLDPETMRHQEPVSQPLDRGSEEALDLGVQIEARTVNQGRQPAPMVVLPTQLTPARKMRMIARLDEMMRWLIFPVNAQS